MDATSVVMNHADYASQAYSLESQGHHHSVSHGNEESQDILHTLNHGRLYLGGLVKPVADWINPKKLVFPLRAAYSAMELLSFNPRMIGLAQNIEKIQRSLFFPVGVSGVLNADPSKFIPKKIEDSGVEPRTFKQLNAKNEQHNIFVKEIAKTLDVTTALFAPLAFCKEVAKMSPPPILGRIAFFIDVPKNVLSVAYHAQVCFENLSDLYFSWRDEEGPDTLFQVTMREGKMDFLKKNIAPLVRFTGLLALNMCPLGIYHWSKVAHSAIYLITHIGASITVYDNNSTEVGTGGGCC